jgi:biotin carboxylase
MSKKVLVLAGTSQQIETITTARRLGYWVLTVDNRPDNPGHKLSDKYCDADTTDREAVLKIARSEGIQGIISPCTDVAVPTAAYVADRMGLKGPPPASALIACSKSEFRKFLERHGLPFPAFVPFSRNFDPGKSFFQSSRWIMKPDESSGSKGTFIVGSREEFLAKSAETLEFSINGFGVLERFVDGFQGTCEGFLVNGRLRFVCILDRRTMAPPYVTTIGHAIPTMLQEKLQQKLFHCLDQVWHLLGVTDGPFDCDFVATEEEIFLLELSPRMGGNSISLLIKSALGFDFAEYSLRYALGEELWLPAQFKTIPSAAVIFGVARDGVLEYDRAEAERISAEPWVCEFFLEKNRGESVKAFVNSRNRVGYAIVTGNDRNDVDARVNELNERLKLQAIYG